MTQTAADKAETKKTAQHANGDIVIPVEKLIFQHANPNGIHVLIGVSEKSEKQMPRLLAGTEGGIKTEIDYMPRVRSYRVKRWHQVTRTVKENGKEIEATINEPLKTYFIPEALAVWIPAGNDL